MVIATQNPIEQAGTYRLPEAQLDRFLMRTSVGHPDAASTEELLLDSGVRDRASLVRPIVKTEQIQQMAAMAREVHVDRAIARYVREIAEASRADARLALGLSARGCLALVRVAKTWAAAAGRTAVVPDDIGQLAKPVLNHRLVFEAEAQFSGISIDQVITELFRTVPPPARRG
jgi:MoxR-like ATPase